MAGDDTWLIAYASQGGTAAQLAMMSRDQLLEAGIAAQFMTLNRLDAETLKNHPKVLFIVSTFGEGEAPDNASRFLPRLKNLDLSHLQYGLLALGDRGYRYFCGFAHAVNHALHGAGAASIFDMIEVDKSDPAALRHWQYYLGQISGQPLFHDWQKAEYEAWYLQNRRCLNPASPGAPAFFLQLVPPVKITPDLWQAGDIAEIGPCNSVDRLNRFLQRLRPDTDAKSLAGLRDKLHRCDLPLDDDAISRLRPLADDELLAALPELPHREYSIASVPGMGSLDLLIRQVRDDQGELGLGSGWMTHHAQTGKKILLRIRRNPDFHPPETQVPLILIGNGTGMAGLRAHLQARRGEGARQNWLLFGERTAAHDFFFDSEILSLQTEGFLLHLDLVFSRDAGADEPRYVQDLLPVNAARLQQWVTAGAAIYVCGSLHGMAQGVDQALSGILGRELLDILAETRRYCRDVY